MKIFLALLMILGAISAHAQTGSDSVYVAKSFWGNRFYHQGERLNINQLAPLLHENSEADILATKAKNKSVLSSILGGAGGFLIGLQLANAIIGGEPNWTVAAVGGGLVVVSIPIFSRSNQLSNQAVDIYNAQLVAKRSAKPQLIFGMSRYGPGVKLHF